ncbi:MAG: aminodeoxychorismate/anthranilate synthase component II [Defluviitaleaceae bacterium]|nr:aminodeoxychorismate/anthranilate synthase component II [Defluviitaleaceae bacterium]MCL2263171.1 aminodeoxychorismate/anthranilate synthase component II [Defluviitaleaceae bacterium]
MILLIDNYDSFSYNLYQLIGVIEPDIKIIRNDELTPQEIEQLNPKRIVISPGPGKPADAGQCINVVKHFYNRLPILGICLGHQAIFEAFGGTVGYAERLMHGKSSMVSVAADNPLFSGTSPEIQAARYHSLAGAKETLPADLEIIAETESGEIMGICHKKYPVYGLQFHPESILTPEGNVILENFIRLYQ